MTEPEELEPLVRARKIWEWSPFEVMLVAGILLVITRFLYF